MASVFLGLDDPEFARPSAEGFPSRARAILESSTVSIRTTAGDLKARMLRDIMPLTSLQVARLVQDGVFDRANVTDGRAYLKISVPLSPPLMSMLQASNEHGPAVERGTVLYCPPGQSNEVSLRVIENPNQPQDARCVPFARLVEGMHIVDAITQAPINVTASIKGAAMLQ
jgi:hypothetical protein